MGEEVHARVGQEVQPSQTACEGSLENGRDVHQDQWPVTFALSSSGQVGPNYRLPTDPSSGSKSSVEVFEEGNQARRDPGVDQYRQEWCQHSRHLEDFTKLQGKEDEGGIELRQCKYLNNIVEQGHRFIKKRTRPMLGFKTFDSAQVILSGIEPLHMTSKGQLAPEGLGVSKTAAEQFFQIAA